MGAEVVNIYGDEWDESAARDRPGWQWKRLPIGRLLGAEQIGASLYELAPGQKTYPYHWQVLEEEWLIVIRGEPTLRDPSGERKLAAGDCVVFKRGPEGAHAVRNDTDEPVRLLMLSAESPTGEVAIYPESNKVGIFGPDLRKFLRADAEIDYYDGEE